MFLGSSNVKRLGYTIFSGVRKTQLLYLNDVCYTRQFVNSDYCQAIGLLNINGHDFVITREEPDHD